MAKGSSLQSKETAEMIRDILPLVFQLWLFATTRAFFIGRHDLAFPVSATKCAFQQLVHFFTFTVIILGIEDTFRSKSELFKCRHCQRKEHNLKIRPGYRFGSK